MLPIHLLNTLYVHVAYVESTRVQRYLRGEPLLLHLLNAPLQQTLLPVAPEKVLEWLPLRVFVRFYTERQGLETVIVYAEAVQLVDLVLLVELSLGVILPELATNSVYFQVLDLLAVERHSEHE